MNAAPLNVREHDGDFGCSEPLFEHPSTSLQNH